MDYNYKLLNSFRKTIFEGTGIDMTCIEENQEDTSYEWNSIRIKLPEEDQSCLVCNIDFSKQTDSDMPVKAYFVDGFFLNNEHQGTNIPLLVTHWLPLPLAIKD